MSSKWYKERWQKIPLPVSTRCKHLLMPWNKRAHLRESRQTLPHICEIHRSHRSHCPQHNRHPHNQRKYLHYLVSCPLNLFSTHRSHSPQHNSHPLHRSDVNGPLSHYCPLNGSSQPGNLLAGGDCVPLGCS